MTNYDRWKLATPDYLEDTDGEAYAEGSDGKSELELQRDDQSCAAYEKQGVGKGIGITEGWVNRL